MLHGFRRLFFRQHHDRDGPLVRLDDEVGNLMPAERAGGGVGDFGRVRAQAQSGFREDIREHLIVYALVGSNHRERFVVDVRDDFLGERLARGGDPDRCGDHHGGEEARGDLPASDRRSSRGGSSACRARERCIVDGNDQCLVDESIHLLHLLQVRGTGAARLGVRQHLRVRRARFGADRGLKLVALHSRAPSPAPLPNICLRSAWRARCNRVSTAGRLISRWRAISSVE